MRNILLNGKLAFLIISILTFFLTALIYCGGEEQADGDEGFLEETAEEDTVISATPLPNEIFIEDNAFLPESLWVYSGTDVHWINFDDFRHTVTSVENGGQDTIFNSGIIEPNDTFTLQFLETGTFPYFDLYRPDTLNGFIIVEEPPQQ